MRPLTDEETTTFFEKLAAYIGRNIKQLIERADEPYCFRLHRDRVYYVRYASRAREGTKPIAYCTTPSTPHHPSPLSPCSERVMKAATAVARDDLAALGVCFGKFTKSKKFHLKVTCLDYLAQYAKYKVWVKPSAEMAFLYGNDVPKSGVARMTEDIPQYAGVIVMSMTNVPLGFGRSNHTTEQCKDLPPTQVVVLHQADIGEYLRMEEELT